MVLCLKGSPGEEWVRLKTRKGEMMNMSASKLKVCEVERFKGRKKSSMEIRKLQL